MTTSASTTRNPIRVVRLWYLRHRRSLLRTPLGDLFVRSVDLHLPSRATVLSTQQVACLAPLAVGIMAMLRPNARGNVGLAFSWVFGLDDQARHAVSSLFASPHTIAASTGVIGLVLLLGWAAGVPGYQQHIVADIWQVETGGFGQLVTARVLWLAAFAALTSALGTGMYMAFHFRLTPATVLVGWAMGAFLVQWITHFLLLGRAIALPRLALGSVFTVLMQSVCLVAIYVWGSFVIDDALNQFGLIGITFLVQAAAVILAAATVYGELFAAEIDRRRHPELWPDPDEDDG